MGLDDDFKKAATDAKNLNATPTDEELLELYSLFKQSEVGDCNTSKPGLFDLKGKYKWEAWNAKKGLSQEDAKKAYVDYVGKLIAKFGLKD